MKISKILSIVTLTVLPFLHTNIFAAKYSQPLRGKTMKKIVNLIDENLSSMVNSHTITGTSAIIENNNGVVWAKSFGYLSKKKTVAVTSKTIFDVGSVSKIFTATGALLAAQHHQIDLTKPIRNYLVDFRYNSRFEKDPLKRINIIDLLEHRAGFEGAPSGNGENISFSTFTDRINSMQDGWLKYPIGFFAYSNMGFDLVGYIIQKQSKQRFADFMNKYLLYPLGMQSSSYDEKQLLHIKNRAIGNASSPVLKSYPVMPCTSLYSNAIDMGQYIRFQLNKGMVNGKELLNEFYLKRMLKPKNWLKYQTTGYELGVYVTRLPSGDVYWHSGMNRNYNSIMFWIPRYNLGMAILTSRDNPKVLNIQLQLIHLMEKVISIVEGGEYSVLGKIDLGSKVKFYKIPVGMIRQWQGNYLAVDSLGYIDGIKIILKNGRLCMLKNSQEIQLEFIGNNEFYAKSIHRLYKFYKKSKSGISQHIVDVGSGGAIKSWIYNYGPNDKYGPNKKSWNKYLGEYVGFLNHEQPKVYGKIYKNNGSLFLEMFNERFHLKEFKSGLFALSTGNILNLQKQPYKLGSYMVLHKVEM